MNRTRVLKPAILLSLFFISMLSCQQPNFYEHINPYQQFYTTNPSLPIVVREDRYEPFHGSAQIYSYSSDKGKDTTALLEQGYEMIGYASFNAIENNVSQNDLIQLSGSLGASVVVTECAYRNTITTSIPYTVQNPGRLITTNLYGTANVNAYAGSSYSYATGTYTGQKSTWVSGGETTYMVPHSVDRYNYNATFWRKIQKFRFGAYYTEAPNSIRATVDRKCVVIQVVVKNSPADNANILPGDIVLGFKSDLSTVNIENISDLNGAISVYSGRPIVLLIRRDNTTKTIKVNLN